ncbi:MAG: 2-amino-4-hydroxy-6-hydroxymethyldihydropteridine diphosphokinase [Candidatus Omnitrophica bacterium]|nr:2-amino-4-hydroxy-6-hydroxymethyldihydropteridine diphosphokinase [Candidatus Omnitrophota bacterium]
MVTCYIGFGSNLGNRQDYIDKAIKRMRLLNITHVRKISKIIETQPGSGPPQGPYLNGVIEIETELSPYELLRALQKIENDLGRRREARFGPRTIDLDILLYGDITIKEEALSIPHPRMLKRDFVMEPLREIAPDVINPVRDNKNKLGTGSHLQAGPVFGRAQNCPRSRGGLYRA